MASPTITILGKTLDQENWPNLYDWASKRPSTLEETLLSIAEVWHGGNLDSAMIALEIDLAHL